MADSNAPPVLGCRRLPPVGRTPVLYNRTSLNRRRRRPAATLLYPYTRRFPGPRRPPRRCPRARWRLASPLATAARVARDGTGLPQPRPEDNLNIFSLLQIILADQSVDRCTVPVPVPLTILLAHQSADRAAGRPSVTGGWAARLSAAQQSCQSTVTARSADGLLLTAQAEDVTVEFPIQAVLTHVHNCAPYFLRWKIVG